MNSSRFMIALIVIFFASWLYTEIIEHVKRVEFKEHVEAFMNRGDRFTREDGEHLQREICRLDPNCVVKN